MGAGIFVAGGGGWILGAHEAIRERTFMVFGLPRSRTGWISTMLSLGDTWCHHEMETRCDSFEGFRKSVFGYGNSSTAAWRLLPHLRESFPKLRYLWVGRKLSRIAHSCASAGHPEFDLLAADRAWCEARNLGAMDQKVIDVEELTIDGCQDIWEHLIPDDAFPKLKVENLLRMNVQLTGSEFNRVTTQPIPWLMEATT